ncbi:MAG: hypothetical protein FJ218_01705 [Ignavibacteria bacterium]|nr:hypothetical protein [Ignavibacteria bacterium]
MQNGQHNIYAVTPDGIKQWKLTDNQISGGCCDWSSDGKWLVFDSAKNVESQYHKVIFYRKFN